MITESLEADEPGVGEHDEPNTSGHKEVVNQDEDDNTRKRLPSAS